MTCLFLAFSAPCGPKLLGLKDEINDILAPFLHRICGRERELPSRGIAQCSWPPPARHNRAKHWDASKLYHRAKDTAIPSVKYPSTPGKTEEDDIDKPRGGILMTTQFTAEISVIGGATGGAWSTNPEYPWTTKHRSAGGLSI